jgi:acetyltransferase-like isoleucine patch superfamily enzyme
MKDRLGRQLSFSELVQKILIRLQTIFLEFELLLLSWIGLVPSHLFRRFFYTLSGLKIGKKSTIHCGARFFNPQNITIGKGTIIGDHAFLDGRAPLVIGSHTAIASHILIYNAQHNIHSPDFEAIIKPVEIGDYVFIGPRVTILPGVKIGNGAIVAAGAVVTKDIPSYQIWGGIPAQKIGDRKNKKPTYHLGRFMLFQ